MKWAAFLLLLSTPAWASATPQAEIRVTLFGQPCLVQGPVDEATLKAIHGISPEQIYPTRESSEVFRKAFEKLKATGALPSALDRYRERLAKRLEALVAWKEGLEGFKKTHQTDLLTAAAQKFPRSRQKELESAVKKIDASKRESLDQASEIYEAAIEPDPEEEFHRAIRRLNVQYICSFEENPGNTQE